MKLRHSYHGAGIDMEVVRKQSYESMNDTHSAPQSTLVHDHPFAENGKACFGAPHWCYNHLTQQVTPIRQGVQDEDKWFNFAGQPYELPEVEEEVQWEPKEPAEDPRI